MSDSLNMYELPNGSQAYDNPVSTNMTEIEIDHPEFINNDFLLLNIGGISYRIRPLSIYNRLGNSRLRRFVLLNNDQRRQSCDGYVESSGEWFFERSSKLFEPVFKYYAIGTLHRPMDICIQEFLDELHFWGIPKTFISSCCRPQYEEEDKEMEEDEFKNLWEGERRKRLWNICEGSTIVSFVSISFVLASIIGLILSSLPEF